jgi:diguanylate cyclase (GGDEF)-like protein
MGLKGWKQIKLLLWEWRGVIVTAPTVAGLTLALRMTGFLQVWEWGALDLFFRWRPTEPQDTRIAIVEIDEPDINYVGTWPIPDQVFAQLLVKIQQQEPRAIGIDVYRDLPVPPGHDKLVEVFETTPNLIGIKKILGDAYGEPVAPPPTLNQLNRVAAVDLVNDKDGKIRRALLSLTDHQKNSIYTLGSRLALMYLKEENITLTPHPSKPDAYLLGKAVFFRLKKNDGAYVRADNGGYQILYNFRKPCVINDPSCDMFYTVSLTDVLTDRIEKDALRDRIVLIGSTADSLKDSFMTSFDGRTESGRTPGVMIHAQLASQIMSAAMDERGLIRVWSEPMEWIWISLWSVIGATLTWSLLGRKWEVISIFLVGGSLAIGSFVAFLAHWWIPVVPSLMTFFGSSVIIIGYIGYTERERSQAQLRFNALHDGLTGLPNRRCLIERLESAIEYGKEHKDYLFAILFLDLDRFKLINDALGHRTGDDLLIAAACRLAECINPRDTVARLGGDEFIILLEDIHDIDRASQVAERIHSSLKSPFYLNGHEVFTSTSIGVVLSTMDYPQPEDWLAAADVAMYRAKARGQGQYEIFNSSMQADMMSQLKLEEDIRQGISREEFELYYQPIVFTKSHQLAGFEALVRWNHPERGFVSPGQFIPLAEETGLIVPLGWWILRTACRQLHTWHQQFPEYAGLKVSVNLSGKQFVQTDLVEKIAEILAETGLEPSTLKLEITEGVVMENADLAIKMLQDIKNLGITLSIDDFGTGYSSLSYLHQFPVDTLKVDRSFVNGMETDHEMLEIARTIVLLAHSLKMDAIAEGVEMIEQVEILKNIDCEYIQGYFFSKPVNVESAGNIIGDSNYFQDKIDQSMISNSKS